MFPGAVEVAKERLSAISGNVCYRKWGKPIWASGTQSSCRGEVVYTLSSREIVVPVTVHILECYKKYKKRTRLKMMVRGKSECADDGHISSMKSPLLWQSGFLDFSRMSRWIASHVQFFEKLLYLDSHKCTSYCFCRCGVAAGHGR